MAAQPGIVDSAGDQYRAAVLEGPGTSPHEYLVWTAFSSQLAMIEDATWWIEDGNGRIPVGNITVSAIPLPVNDGTLKVIVRDNGGRQIGRVTHLVIARGDETYTDKGWVDLDDPSQGRKGSAPYYVCVPDIVDQDPVSGVVTLTDSNVFTATGSALVTSDLNTLFGGGLSLQREDVVVGVRYALSAVKFWWTRNDRYETRFGWNGALQRWAPYKGSGPINLDRLLFDEVYKLSPPLSNLPVGSVLPGNALVGDQYAMVRLGSSAGATSLPVGVSDPDGFTGIHVVSDSKVASTFDFAGLNYAGVVGQTSGTLYFNPLFVEKHAGETIWYVYRGFSDSSDGYVGGILDENLFIAPVPGLTDRPFVRINNRTPLSVQLAADDAELTSQEPIEGSCVVSLTTGRLKLAKADLDKADPEKLSTFNKHFLGARIVYDGVALNSTPQPVKGPAALVQSDGVTTTLHATQPMYLNASLPWPEQATGTNEGYRGLGISGVLYMPDNTGAVPEPEGVDPSLVSVPTRPGGDTLTPPGGGGGIPQTIGLIRQIHDGVGDTILFSKNGAVSEIVVVSRNSDLPDLPHEVPGGTAWIAREESVGIGTNASKVQLSTETRKLFANQTVYFLQASFNPATYTTLASIASKSRIIFRFDGDETLYFAIDGTAHEWASASLVAALPDHEFFTSGEVAASIQAQITMDAGTGICRASGDRVVLEEVDPTIGLVEIGWGSPRDLSGAAALGFLPGWQAEAGKANWLSDAGISMGLSRSLLNLDRSKSVADYFAQYRLEDQVLALSIQPTPFAFFDFPPVEDIAGYDDGVFFNMQTVAFNGDDLRIINKRLKHFEDIEHRFSEGNFAWLADAFSSNQVMQKTGAINLGNPSIVPESLLGAPGIGGAFLTAEDGGQYVIQRQGDDYLILDDGQSGSAQLITRHGARATFGAKGVYTAGGTTFEDANADFVATLKPGYRIALSAGDAAGSYIVQTVTDTTHCEVQPPFVADADRATPWEAFEGFTDAVYDPAIVADQVFKRFNHLPEEPFRVRVLCPLGVVGPVGVIGVMDFRAYVEDANTSGRGVSLRFGPVHPAADVVASLTPLTLTSIGVLANDQLILPQTIHVLEEAFSLLVGTVLYEGNEIVSGTDLLNNPSNIKWLTEEWFDGTTLHPVGQLRFSDAILVELESSGVTLVETLRASSDMVAGEAEYDPKTGDVRISFVDAETHVGKMLYFAEQMVTEEPGADVKLSPMIGAVSFRKPIRTGCLVEMEYWLANVEGRRVGGVDDFFIEFLPVFVRRETATRLSDQEFEFDSLGVHVIAEEIEPIVYVGPMQQNFGKTDFTKDKPSRLLGTRLTFDRNLPAWATPVVTYGVFDALGGERAYETSQKPVYRPPFFIKADKDNFGLRGNRVADFEVGQMMRIGADCFYIVKLQHFPDPDTTRVDIYPPTTREVGSRSPGNDVLTLVTASPITPLIDPDGEAPLATAAPEGFMQEIVGFEFEPVNAKQSTITFLGDLTTFAIPGHIMEIAGLPFTIAQVGASEDGTRTKITFTSPFLFGISPSNNPTIRLSYRPIYPPETRQFLGLGPFVDTENVELTIFGEFEDGVEQPGRRMAQGTEFQIDPETGGIQLSKPLGSKQTLLLSFTQIRTMEPFFQNGVVQFPRWLASYKHNVVPDGDNGYLGGTLTATYTFDSPDSFYYRALPLRNYLAEAISQAVKEMKQGQSSGGPQLSVAAGEENWDHGNLGLLSQRSDLLDKDRAARSLLSFYNNTVVAFEQVDECISGKFIGDRDGKFRFWVGRGLDYAPPGYEDSITGDLNATNVWGTVYNQDDPTRDLTFLVDGDKLVKPESATLTDLQLTGLAIGAARLNKMMDRQKLLVRNDVDDILLLASSLPQLIKTGTSPYFRIESGGTFVRMGTTHRYSRLFPTAARVLFTLQPGIGSDTSSVGTYSWAKFNPDTGDIETTHGTQIGQVANPVLGDIKNVSESVIRPRLPRIRIISYHPEGLPASAFGVAIRLPCVVVSAVPLSELPIDPATGFPDTAQLLSIGPGELSDAVAGDPDLALPGFLAGQKLGWGRPDGSILAALYPEEISIPLIGSLSFYTSVFVGSVLHGCVITFADRFGQDIDDPYKLLVGTGRSTGIPAHIFGIGRSDTLYVQPPDADNPILDPSTESPTLDVMKAAALAAPAFRQGLDITVGTDGRVIDLSLPSWTDPSLFPLKEVMGQKSPLPMSHLEGGVQFANVEQLPLNTPALLGQAFDDSGDIQIPYMKTTNTELDRFDEITNLLGPLMAVVPSGGGVYPDEFLFIDGEVVDEAVVIPNGAPDYKEPATLMTMTETNPAGTFGVTPAREGDFVLVEVNPGSPEGWQGFLAIGALRNKVVDGNDWSWIEPPRYVTQVSKGSLMEYRLLNYMVHTTPGDYPSLPQTPGSEPPGVRLYQNFTGSGSTYAISFGEIAFTLNDGAAGAGNLNTILAANSLNFVKITLLARTDDGAIHSNDGTNTYTSGLKDGRPIWSITITSVNITVRDELTGLTRAGHPIAHNGVTFGAAPEAWMPETGHTSVILFTNPVDASGDAFDLVPIGGELYEWYLPNVEKPIPNSPPPIEYRETIYGFEAVIDVDTSAGASTSAYIDSDRLTFHEVLDFTKSRPRGFLHTLGTNVYETSLHVLQVETPLGMNAINDVAAVPLTFESREETGAGPHTSIQGTWNPAATPNEEGSIRVMGFEVSPNTPITLSGATASVVASQAEASDGAPILEGTGFALDNHISDVTLVTGGIGKVEKGDVLYLDKSNNALTATSKAGTYIVRYSVDPTVVPAGTEHPYLPVTLATNAGTGTSFIKNRFPRIISIDYAGPDPLLVVDDASMLPASGHLYCAIRPGDLPSFFAALFQKGLFSADFLSIAAGPGSFSTLTLGTPAAGGWRWADGVSFVTASTEITNDLVVGKQFGWHDEVNAGGAFLTGVLGLDVSVRGGDLPEDPSVVGLHDAAGVGVDNARYGFREFDFTSDSGTVNVPIASIPLGTTPAAGEVSVDEATIHANETFDATGEAAVYPEVPGRIYAQIDATQGDALYNLQGHPVTGAGLACLLPGVQVEASFFALGGVFVEPSVPHFPVPLIGITPKVVDAARSLGAGTTGMLNPLVSEDIHFEVRRVRRWHGAQNALNDAFRPLQFAYEIRRGRISGFTRNEQQVGLLTAASFTMDWNTANAYAPDVWNDGKSYTGTNLGPFDSEDVNIHPGDMLRLLNDDGTVLAEGVIAEVGSDEQLRIQAPGFADLTATNIADIASGGRRFEVFLRRAPVPHEQSNEQLLEIITDRLVYETVADRSDGDPQNWVGGYVPEVFAAGVWPDITNMLFDDSATPSDFVALGVREGDIVIIDPAGTMPVVDEMGARPLGDKSVLTRTNAPGGGTPHVAGSVSSLDDNRGFYRVSAVAAASLTLDPVHDFAGTLDADVLLAESQPDITYAIYPTVALSVLNATGGEGQNDLRPTRKAVGGTYTDSGDAVADKHSIGPFSYRIIRPSSVFSDEIVDMVLMMRERMLSLIELFRSAMTGAKGGYYWNWQADEHVTDLGEPGDPTSGLGLFANQMVTTLVGETDHSPFINTNDCLSLLDRRFWVLDTKLDSLEPDPDNPFGMRTVQGGETYPDVDGPYTAYNDPNVVGTAVRPVLPDQLGLILDVRDRLRAIRYTWLTYRTHRYIGTLARIKRFDEDLPVRLDQRKQTLLLEQTADGVAE